MNRKIALIATPHHYECWSNEVYKQANQVRVGYTILVANLNNPVGEPSLKSRE
jgi:hypothetical protein